MSRRERRNQITSGDGSLMRHSSLRGNLLWLAGIYLVSLVVASGCPTNDAPPSKPTALPASINPPEPSIDEALGTAAAPVQPPAVEPAPAERPAAAVAPPPGAEPALLPENPRGQQTSIAFRGAAIPIDGGNSKAGVAPGDEFFPGWGIPQLAIVITGEQNGYMEPCGCAGLENMKGGIGRRHDMLQQLTAKGWPVTAVDVGGLVRRFGKQAELQFDSSAQALRTMGYQAVGLGADDLRLSTGEVAVAAAPEGKEKSIFVAANADVYGLVPKWRIFKAGGLTLGVVAVLGDEAKNKVNNGDVNFTHAADEIAAALPQLTGCDHRILLSHASVNESKELAKKFPAFDIVVTGGTHGDPPHLLRNVEGRALSNIDGRPSPDAEGQIFVETGDKGMFAIVLGFYPGQKLPHYQRVALDKRYTVTPEMKQIMADLQKKYETLGWEGLGVKPRPHGRATDKDPKSGQFVGSANCRACHKEAYKIWDKSGHAHATDTLVKLDPPRQFDAECLSCHVTGWNPQEYFPYDTGFLGLKETPHLVGNGCENCHGPGAAHVAAEEGSNAALQKELRNLMHIPLETAAQSCKTCHDTDNSPEFNKVGFEKYWEKIAH